MDCRGRRVEEQGLYRWMFTSSIRSIRLPTDRPRSLGHPGDPGDDLVHVRLVLHQFSHLLAVSQHDDPVHLSGSHLPASLAPSTTHTSCLAGNRIQSQRRAPADRLLPGGHPRYLDQCPGTGAEIDLRRIEILAPCMAMAVGEDEEQSAHLHASTDGEQRAELLGP